MGFKKFLKRLKEDQRGIVALWGAIFISMVVYFICWFTMGLPLIYIIDALRTQVTLAGATAMMEAVIDGCLFAFEIHPVIALVGWFIYGLLHSARRDTDVYRYQ